MVLNQIDARSILDSDDSTTYTGDTPAETVAGGHDSSRDIDSYKPSVPWPGSTFIIRSASCGRMITLLDGEIVLAQPDVGGSIRWRCTESKGWLGFRDRASNRFLGHDVNGTLICRAELHRWWECFNARHKRDGGYVLLMTHYREHLWHVGIKMERGVEKLAKIDEGGSGGIVWEFIEVK